MHRSLARSLALLSGPTLLAAAHLAGCGGGGGSGGSSGGAPASGISGFVLGYDDEPLGDVPVQVLGGVTGATRLDGLILAGPAGSGARVLRVGDSVSHPTLLLPFTGNDAAGAFLDRPVYLPALSSGPSATIVASVGTTTVVSGPEVPGLELSLAGGTSVTYPAGAPTQLRLLPVSPSRLPVALPTNLAARAAILVEPFGASFTPAATLRLPRQDGLGAAPYDAYEVSPTSGQWQLLQTNVAVVNTDTVAVSVARGTLVAVVPRQPPTTNVVTGRVVAGNQPLAGFRATCWGKVSDPTGVDGRFTITDVPTSFGTFYVRVYPEKPAVDFAPGVTVVTSPSANLGDVVVAARPPDSIKPLVRSTSPTDGQGGVGPEVQVVVTFSEAIDRRTPAVPVSLTGRQGPVATRLIFDNAFTVRLIPTKLLNTSETYTVLVDRSVRDLAGNRVDDSALSAAFTTRGGAPPATATDTAAFSVAPLSAAKGETVTVAGRNFTGGTTVTFGSSAGLVTGETAEEVRAVVPDFQPAGDVTLTLAAGGQAVAPLRPLVLDLRPTVATVYSGATPQTRLVFLDRNAPPPVLVVDGNNVGGGAVTIDGVSIAAVDSTIPVGTTNVATGRRISVSTPAPSTLLTGPVVVRGANGQPARVYRFLFVRDGP